MSLRVANIGIAGGRRRLLAGLAALALGVAIVVVVLLAGASPGWALLALAPFWGGALGVVQARERT
jgi:hypothetical protein